MDPGGHSKGTGKAQLKMCLPEALPRVSYQAVNTCPDTKRFVTGVCTICLRTPGRVLRNVRQTRDLSQEELAARAGYHRTYIGQLERGEKSPSLRTVFNLCSTLQVNPSVLIRKVERSLTR